MEIQKQIRQRQWGEVIRLEVENGVDKHLQTMEAMNRLMREEPAARGIEISQNHGNIIIRTASRKGHKDG